MSEWIEARRLGCEIIAAVEDRAAIIAERNLDPAFCLPAANWAPDAPNDYLDAYRLLRTLDWNEVRHLRLRCQNFSGFSLLHMRTSQGLRSTVPVPKDLHIDPEPPAETLDYWRKLTQGLPTRRVFHPPCALGEIGWRIDDGVIMNYETCVYQERLTLLHRSGILDWLEQLDRPPRILEIGAGHGALACALMSTFPECQYTICDLPESLLFSGLYLTLAARLRCALLSRVAAPIQGVIELVPNYLFEDICAAHRSYDLAINVLSMSEMSEEQVNCYGRGIAAMLGSEGVFFEQNQDDRPRALGFVANVLTDMFPTLRKVVANDIPLTQGRPHLWSNAKSQIS
jgi:hypothetical protein